MGSQIEAVFKRFDGFTKHSSVNMLNLNAKIFAELAENQSLYFKISGQFEDMSEKMFFLKDMLI